MESNQRKHTLNLREGDYAAISEAYAPHGIKAATVIRSIVSKFVDTKLKGKEDTPAVEGVDVEIE